MALGLGALLGSFAFPLALWLCTNMVARLLFFGGCALHVANWLTALSLALGTILTRTEMFGANHLAIWLPALHLTVLGVEALATR